MNLEMVSSHQKKQKEREDENDKISVTFFYKDVEKAKSKENEYDFWFYKFLVVFGWFKFIYSTNKFSLSELDFRL